MDSLTESFLRFLGNSGKMNKKYEQSEQLNSNEQV